jgi:hypothetical protein
MQTRGGGGVFGPKTKLSHLGSVSGALLETAVGGNVGCGE